MRARPWRFLKLCSLACGCSLCLLAFHGCVAVGEEEVGPSAEAVAPAGAETEFYSTLAPYGEWVAVPGVAGPVWRPYPWVVGADFVPYATGGNWQYSDWGWTFVSVWSWGWAPFHYGRWFFEPSFGWCWLPGTEWAPAWVQWRWGDGYAGWAPLPPPGIRVRPSWTFVEGRNFLAPNVARYRIPPEREDRVLHRTAEIQNQVRHGQQHWNRGPEPRMVERDTGQPLRRTTVQPPPPGHPAPRPPQREAARTPPPARPPPAPPPPRAEPERHGEEEHPPAHHAPEHHEPAHPHEHHP